MAGYEVTNKVCQLYHRSEDEGRIGGRAGRGKRRDQWPACVQRAVRSTGNVVDTARNRPRAGISSGTQYEGGTRNDVKGLLMMIDDMNIDSVKRKSMGWAEYQQEDNSCCNPYAMTVRT